MAQLRYVLPIVIQDKRTAHVIRESTRYTVPFTADNSITLTDYISVYERLCIAFRYGCLATPVYTVTGIQVVTTCFLNTVAACYSNVHTDILSPRRPIIKCE